MKIVILGLGGVGGYYGGKLARRYYQSPDVEICFIARGEHLKKIKSKGIHIRTEKEDFFAKPKLVTNQAAEIGNADYVIMATKSYDIASSLTQIAACIDRNTVILPLLNGGDITERIRELLPENVVWSGCSYIVSRKTAQGEITSYGNIERFVFGYDKGVNDELRTFEKVLRGADIDVKLEADIRKAIWKKFYFISVSASLTSYFGVSFNSLNSTEAHQDMTRAVSREFLGVAAAEGVDLTEMDENEVLRRADNLPPNTTTSMHSDFKAGNHTEVETLTGVVVRLGHKHKVAVPMYEKVYQQLITQ